MAEIPRRNVRAAAFLSSAGVSRKRVLMKLVAEQRRKCCERSKSSLLFPGK